jgi:probable HAF family extracellular repeat protein
MRFTFVRSMVTMVALGVATVPAVAGSYTFTTISPPDLTGVILGGVSASGVAVGSGLDSSGNVVSFLDSSGNFSTINFPGSAPGTTNVAGINGPGQYVGNYQDTSGNTHGFISVGNTLQTFDLPSSSVTSVNGISNNGKLVGVGPTDLVGFSFSNGTFTPVQAPTPPNPGFPPPSLVQTIPDGVNNAGDVVGTIFSTVLGPQGSRVDGFLLHNGKYTLLDFPGPPNTPSASHTEVLGINDNGVIVGTYFGIDQTQHGFIYQNGVFTTFDDPLASELPGFGTFVNGINDAGQITGGYTDDTGNSFGFIATPVPEPGSLALLSVVGLAVAARRLRKRG